jgi:hypothetical protein
MRVPIATETTVGWPRSITIERAVRLLGGLAILAWAIHELATR